MMWAFAQLSVRLYPKLPHPHLHQEVGQLDEYVVGFPLSSSSSLISKGNMSFTGPYETIQRSQYILGNTVDIY